MGILDRLGQGNYLMDLGAGLLANSGYSPVPVTFGQAFGGAMQHANQARDQRLQNQLTRQSMESDIARRKAVSNLAQNPSVIRNVMQTFGLDDPQAAADMITSNPDGVINNLYGPKSGGTRAMQEYAWINSAPDEQEAQRRAAFIAQATQGAGMTPQDRLNMKRTELDIARMIAEMNAENAENARKRGNLRNTVEETIGDVIFLSQLNEELAQNYKLQGTEAGGLEAMARQGDAIIESITGEPVFFDDAKALNDKREQFKLLAPKVALKLQQLEEQRGGGSNFELETLLSTKGDPTKNPTASALAFESTLKEIYNVADELRDAGIRVDFNEVEAAIDANKKMRLGPIDKMTSAYQLEQRLDIARRERNEDDIQAILNKMDELGID